MRIFSARLFTRCHAAVAMTIALPILFFASNANLASAQQPAEPTLTIGSKAPALDIENWVSDRNGSFEHITTFEEGKIYVIEFWATWCGPCIRSMPHLAKTQEQYADKGVQIISVTDEELETVDGFLEKNVIGNEAEDERTYRQLTSAYCLTSDPDESTSLDYMVAAGQRSIPTAFIVGKTGLIEWTGHVADLEMVLAQVAADQWDRETFKEVLREQQEQEAIAAAVGAKLNEAMDEVDQKLDNGEDAAALEIMNGLVENDEFAVKRTVLSIIRAKVALTIDGPDAVKAFEASVETLKELPDGLNELAWSAYETAVDGEKLSDGMTTAAMNAVGLAMKAMPNDPSILDTVAHLYHLQGDLDKAIEAQEKAVANAGDLGPQIQPYLDELKAEKAKTEQ